ncbi:MAG: hypothetical protein LQ342_006223 [Letrouitia transgressa]|nr:MAG: hypothetical protein LQ342_006223 [Letrouitia transgressa]
MPRHSKNHDQALPNKTLVLDNGANTIKAGFVGSPSKFEDCQIIPNCLARGRDKKVYVGSELDSCRDFGEMAFRRPVEKGYIVNWEAEKAVWDHSFFAAKSTLPCNPHESNLVLAEAPNTPVTLQINCDQVVFEEYEFASYSRWIGPSLNAYHDIQCLFGAVARKSEVDVVPAECLLVVDSGFSHSTVTPLVNGRPIQQAVRRLDVGGKILTNYLKELVSIRHYNLMNEDHLVNEAKEQVCFVSSDFRRDLESTWKGASESRKQRDGNAEDIVVDYVLPDYNAATKGFMRPHDPSLAARVRKMGAMANPGGIVEDFMTLGNERFSVPELLFNPGDIGMQESGLSETVLQSLSGLPPGLWPAMLGNVLVVGGNALIKGFVERLEAGVRQLAPAECVVRVVRSPDPLKSTWLGGATMAADPTALKAAQVTRQEYQEFGSGWLAKVFSGASRKP